MTKGFEGRDFNEIDVLILGLPMVGDLLKNGLDTIRILKEHIVSKL